MRRRDLHVDNPRRFGNGRESKIGKDHGFSRVPGSGSSAVKGDLRAGDVMVEVKATRANSYRVSADVMAKLRNDGLTNGRRGVLVVELGEGTRFAVMPMDMFEEALHACEVQDEGDAALDEGEGGGCS